MLFLSQHTAARDLAVIRPYMDWHRPYWDYGLRRLWLAPRYPADVIRAFAPDLVPPLPLSAPLLPLGGCPTLKDDASPEERERLVAISRKNLQAYLTSFRLAPRAVAATRALLNRLRSEGVRTVLVLMPEGSLVKGWYGPGAREQVDEFCAAVSREYDLPLLDAREWLADGDMYDGHHPLRRGAETFTRRLAAEVLGSYLALGDTTWAADLRRGHGYNACTPARTIPAPEAPCSFGSPASPSPPTPSLPTGSNRSRPTSGTSDR
jgi:hypothetical protein